MTLTEPVARIHQRTVALDLYRDIHKGIRSEMFAAVTTAGCLDPADVPGAADLAARVEGLVRLLREHAEHEDRAIQPLLEQHLPDLAARIADDHERIERRLDELVDLARIAGRAAVDGRGRLHRLYVELASFTGAYLEHQDVEERVVMPALDEAVGVEAVGGIHAAIIAAIPPEEMARSLSVMMPAMNIDDRSELLGGMQAGAPPEAFAAVWDLVCSVLGDQARPLGDRLGL
jgi:hypothetical protein